MIDQSTLMVLVLQNILFNVSDFQNYSGKVQVIDGVMTDFHEEVVVSEEEEVH